MAQSEEIARAARSDLELQQEQKKRARKVKRDEEQACQLFIEMQLRDWLLLTIRGGGWHLTHKLSEGVDARLPHELAVRRYRLSGRSPDRVITAQQAQGKYLFLKDVVQLLKRQGLIEVRSRADGEEEIQSTPRKDPRFEIDTAFRDLLPRSPDEVARLEAQLLAEGCRDPLVVWKGHGLLVDGYSRFDLLSLTGRKYAVREIAFKDRREVLEFIQQLHYGRRNLSDEMKSYVRGKEYLAAKKSHGGARDKSSGHSAHLKRTAEIIGAKYGLDATTIRRDAQFAAALDEVAANCGDEVRERMLSRTIKWTRGDIRRLAKLEPAEQERIVKKALASGKRPKLPASAAKCKLLSFPLGDSEAQAEVLHRLLKGKAFDRLCAALNKRQEWSSWNGTSVNMAGKDENGVTVMENHLGEMGRLSG